MGSDATPIATVDVSNSETDYLAAVLAANSQDADASTWGGGDETTRFAMSATIAPRMKGPIYVTVKAAKASTTYYVDPKIVLS